MKIPFKFQEIDSMLQGDYESKFKAALKKIKTKANSPETAIEVFLNQEHEFSDETSPILIAGKISGPWLKWVKDKVKANKKMTLMGKGYVETDENGNDKLTIMKLKGNIKIDKFKKEAKKLLKKVKLAAIDIVEDFNTEENGQSSDVADASETTENTQPKDEATAVKELLVKISKLNKSIDLKNGLQESDLQNATAMKKAIQEFANLLKKASGAIRKEFGPQFIKTKALYAKLDEEIKKLQANDDALEAALNDTLGLGDEEDSEQGDQAPSEDETSAFEDIPEATNRQEAIAKSDELLTVINELVEEMDLHAIA